MTPLDSSASQLVAMMAAAGQPGLETLAPTDARVGFSMGMMALQSPAIEVGAVADLLAKGAHGAIPLRSYRPLHSDPKDAIPVIVFFHGGGFFLGDLDVFDRQCRRLCQASNCAVISVDYRMAPEHRFPAAAEDAFAAVRWIAANAAELGIDPARLAVAGDSAGGNLAAGVCLMARETGGPAIAQQILLYPFINLHAQPVDGIFLTEALARHSIALYTSSEAERSDWRASPTLATNHSDLPPAIVLACGHDPLFDDCLAYSAALKRAGVAVKEIVYPGQIHGFLLMDAVLPEAATAMDEVGRLVRIVLKGASS